MGLKLLKLVIFHHVLSIADDLQYHHVAAMGHDESFFLAQGGIIFRVDFKAVAVHELVFGIAAVQGRKAVVPDKAVKHVLLSPGRNTA